MDKNEQWLESEKPHKSNKDVNKKEKTIIKKDYALNIGSDKGGKDRIFNLKKGATLPAEIPAQFKQSLTAKQVI